MAHYTEYTWVLVCSIFVAVFMAYGIGANDVANAFGSSVGARALTMKQAIFVAAVCEFGGASLMGEGVTSTIRSGIAQLSYYTEKPDVLMYGMLCALLSCGLWLILATFWELPVSTTHSIVGAIVGMSMVAAGPGSVLWSAHSDSFPYLQGVSLILIAWAIAPILSAIVAVLLFLITRHGILRRRHSFQLSLLALPAFTFLAFFIIPFFIIQTAGQGEAFGWQEMSGGKAAWISASIAGGMTVLSIVAGIPLLRWKVHKEYEVIVLEAQEAAAAAGHGRRAEEGKGIALQRPVAALGSPGTRSGSSSDSGARSSNTPTAGGDVPSPSASASGADVPTTSTSLMLRGLRTSRVWRMLSYSADVSIHDAVEKDKKIHEIHAHSEMFDPRTELSFKYLQVCTACANSFSHGSNDVANAMGPMAAIYSIWQCTCVNETAHIPEWILVIGGVGIVLGLATYGYKVMRALGVKLTRLTNSRGFCVELGSAIVVLLGSRYGVPLSTTHCMVGAVTGIGLLEGAKGFNSMLLLKVIGGWIATLAVSGLTAAAFTAQGIFAPNQNAADARGWQTQAINASTVATAALLNATAFQTEPPNATLVNQSQALLALAGQQQAPIVQYQGVLQNQQQAQWFYGNGTLFYQQCPA